MEVFVQQLINGITLGSIYGLIAIGYTMVFGIIGMVNFAHGDVFMVSAFIALITLLLLTTWLGIRSRCSSCSSSPCCLPPSSTGPSSASRIARCAARSASRR
jgi:ABC-type branched-subunit amino acid transport system permease subunit